MYKIILSILCFNAFWVSAQITINSSDMPSNGDTIRYSTASAGTYDFKLTGTDYHWDYSNIGINDQDLYSFKALLSTPYATLTLTGLPIGSIGYKIADSINLGTETIKDVYNFYQKTSNGWFGVGTAVTLPIQGYNFKTGGVYSDKDDIFTFDLKYDDYDSTTFRVTTPLIAIINVGSFVQKGYRVNKVEGWGKISTPYANNINCLKVKSRVEEMDSLKVAIPTQTPISIGFPISRVEYKWLSKTEKIPMMEVTGTEIGSIFTPATIRYRDNFRNPVPSPLGPQASFTVNKDSGIAQLDTFRLINQTSPSIGNTYEWTIAPNAGVRYVKGTTSFSSNPQVVFDNAGKYSVKLKATNIAGFRDTTVTDLITIKPNPAKIQSVSTLKSIIYPNPSSDKINFNAPQLENALYAIYDLNGKMIINGVVGKSLSIDVSSFEKGKYILVLNQNNIYLSEIISIQ
jgi:hypothetical protein